MCGLLPEWLRWLFAALAVYRLSQLVVYDDGPWDVLLRFRTWRGVYDFHESGESGNKFLSCPFCVGVWIAGALLIVVLTETMVGDLFLAWWGLAGAQALLEGRNGTG
jgi:hypothetical protein